MKKTVGLFFIILIALTSCVSEKEKEIQRQQRLSMDSTILTDSIQLRIYRIDSSVIETNSFNKKVNALMDSAKVSGLAVSILNDNKIIYRNAFGYSNANKKNKLLLNSSFYGASLSKAVFGYLVAQLTNEGKIDLDTPLQHYLDLPLYELKADDKWRSLWDLKGDERYKKITARMCMSHTTGLQNWRWIPRPNDPANKRILKIYFDPGTEYYYSGEGMMLLQYVIEHITGKGIEQLAKEKIFIPLKMNNTSYLWQERFELTFCNGHTSEQKTIKKDKRDVAGAAGSMETNLIDYSIFVQHILRLYSEQSKITDVLFKPNFRIKTKAQFGPNSLIQSNENDNIKLSYGLGWGILESPYGFGAFKEGHGEGFQHYTILFPERKIAMIMLSNSDNAESIFKELLEIGIANTYTPWKWENYIPYQMKNQ